jgi:hypothetical protein
MAGVSVPYKTGYQDPLQGYADAARARAKKQADEDAAAANARTNEALRQSQAAVSGNNARYTVDANGKASYTEGTNPSAMSALQNLWGSYGSSAATGTSPSGAFPTVSYGGGSVSGGSPSPSQVSWNYTPSGGSTSTPQVAAYNPSNASATNIAPIANINTDEAQAAAFARAKDQAGLVARGALTGLSGAMAGRGTVGSGVEGRGQQSIINAGQQNLGDVVRQQAMTKADLAQQTAEANYSGGIAQRGQDLSNLQSQNQNVLAARGQDISQRGQDINQLSDQQARDLAIAQTGYQGGISQRGQDLSQQEALAALQAQQAATQYQGGISQRGQDIQNSQFGQDLEMRKKQQQYAMLQGLMGAGGSY